MTNSDTVTVSKAEIQECYDLFAKSQLKASEIDNVSLPGRNMPYDLGEDWAIPFR